MGNLRHAELFGLAMDLLSDRPVRERKRDASKAVGLSVAAATGGSIELSALVTLTGQRAAEALMRAAREATSHDVAGTVPPWAPNESPSVAISTAKETLAEARDVRSELLAANLKDVWLYDRIPAGRRILDEVERVMSTGDYILLIASEAANDSEWVQFEMSMVQNAELHGRRDRLIPVLVDVRTRDLRPLLQLPRNIRWEDGGARNVASELIARIRDDRRRQRQ